MVPETREEEEASFEMERPEKYSDLNEEALKLMMEDTYEEDNLILEQNVEKPSSEKIMKYCLDLSRHLFNTEVLKYKAIIH